MADVGEVMVVPDTTALAHTVLSNVFQRLKKNAKGVKNSVHFETSRIMGLGCRTS